jgi:hypothetical protein
VRLGGDREQPRLLPGRVDAQLGEVGLELGEVGAPRGLERVELAREARGAVREPVRQRGVDEAAVAATGAPARRLGLQQHDLAVRALALRQHGGPQAGEAAADDREVRLDVAVERRRLVGPWSVEPERQGRGVAHAGRQRTLPGP